MKGQMIQRKKAIRGVVVSLNIFSAWLQARKHWGKYKRQRGLLLHHSSIISVWAWTEKKSMVMRAIRKKLLEAVSSLQIFFKIGVLKNFANFTGKHPWLESLFNTVAGLKACNFIPKTLHTGVFLWILRNFYVHLFFTEHLKWLPLKLKIYILQLRIYYVLE